LLPLGSPLIIEIALRSFAYRMPQFTLFSVLLFFMAGICVLIAAGQFFLAKTGTKKYIWAIAYFLVGSLMAFGAFVHSDLLVAYPHLYGPHISLSFFPALGFYTYFRRWLYAEEKLYLRYHIIPGVTAFVATLPLLFSSAEVKQQAILSYYHQGVMSWREYLFLAGMFSNVVYAGWLALEARVLYRNIHVHGRSIFALTAICAVISNISILVIMTAYILRNRNVEQYGLMGLMVAACCGYFFMQRAAHISAEMQKSIDEERYRKSRLSGVNINNLKIALDKAMLEERIFTDFELTMPALAEKIGVKPHQLSEFLNVHANKKFTEFLNDYRIADAKQRLIREPDLNVLNVGYASGFNSKSTFNSIFRKYTGLSPTEFREQELKKMGVTGPDYSILSDNPDKAPPKVKST
jgi:AraC-like DNA-binding protein